MQIDFTRVEDLNLQALLTVVGKAMFLDSHDICCKYHSSEAECDCSERDAAYKEAKMRLFFGWLADENNDLEIARLFLKARLLKSYMAFVELRWGKNLPDGLPPRPDPTNHERIFAKHRR